MERKRAYDAAYVEWNANSQAILLRARSTIMQPLYSRIENLIEESLVQRIFAPLDSCLIQAFDITIRHVVPSGSSRPGAWSRHLGARGNKLARGSLETTELFRRHDYASGLAMACEQHGTPDGGPLDVACPLLKIESRK